MSSETYWVYVLKCVDDTYYVGMTNNLELRLAPHHQGLGYRSYTTSRRPVELIWSQQFPSHDEAFICERQIKGWSRSKKAALINGNWDEIHGIVTHERKTRRLKAKQLKSQISKRQP
jgi:predicted GIY-YIG superfamily endonuclease